MPQNTPNAVFVYGTLQKGEVNDGYLTKYDGSWQNGYVLGTLQQKGWGAKFGFPGIQLDPLGDKVPGMIFRSDDIEHILAELDVLEGPEYARTITPVRLNNGTIAEAFIYELARAGN